MVTMTFFPYVNAYKVVGVVWVVWLVTCTTLSWLSNIWCHILYGFSTYGVTSYMAFQHMVSHPIWLFNMWCHVLYFDPVDTQCMVSLVEALGHNLGCLVSVAGDA